MTSPNNPPEVNPDDFISLRGGPDLSTKAIVVQQREPGLIEIVYLDRFVSVAEDMKWLNGQWNFVKSSQVRTYAAASNRLAPFALKLRAELKDLD